MHDCVKVVGYACGQESHTRGWNNAKESIYISNNMFIKWRKVTGGLTGKQ